jgi:DNA-binding response OmpR family regulator
VSRPAVLLVSSDLLWIGKVRAAADRAGWEVRVPDKKTEVTHQLLDGDTRLVLVDLHHPRFDFVETIRLVRGTRWDARLVCFGHHTDTARLARASEAGAQEVWPNSELDRRLAGLLRISPGATGPAPRV